MTPQVSIDGQPVGKVPGDITVDPWLTAGVADVIFETPGALVEFRRLVEGRPGKISFQSDGTGETRVGRRPDLKLSEVRLNDLRANPRLKET